MVDKNLPTSNTTLNTGQLSSVPERLTTQFYITAANTPLLTYGKPRDYTVVVV